MGWGPTCFELRVLSGIASKSTIIDSKCAGMSFERLSFEMSKDNLAKDSPAQVGLEARILGNHLQSGFHNIDGVPGEDLILSSAYPCNTNPL